MTEWPGQPNLTMPFKERRGFSQKNSLPLAPPPVAPKPRVGKSPLSDEYPSTSDQRFILRFPSPSTSSADQQPQQQQPPDDRPLLVQRFPPSPKDFHRVVVFRSLKDEKREEKTPPPLHPDFLKESERQKPRLRSPPPPESFTFFSSPSSSSSSTTTTAPSPNNNNFTPLNMELDNLLWRLQQSISEAAFNRGRFTSHLHLKALDRLLKNSAATSPTNSSSSSCLLPKINAIVVHCADVIRYFWAVLLAPVEQPSIHEPITDTLVLLRTVLGCEAFSAQLTTDAYLYLLESALPYLVLYSRGALAAFPSSRKSVAQATAHRLYCFVEAVLLLPSFRLDLGYRSAPQPLSPGLVTTAWLRLYARYLAPGFTNAYPLANPFTRAAFSENDRGERPLPVQQIRLLLVDFLQTVLRSIVGRLNDCPPLLRRLHYPSLVEELERVEQITRRCSWRSYAPPREFFLPSSSSSEEESSSISHQFLATLSKYPSTVGGSPSLAEGGGGGGGGGDTHPRLNKLIFDVLFHGGGFEEGGGSGWSNSLQTRRRRGGGGGNQQSSGDCGLPHSAPPSPSAHPRSSRQRHHSAVAVGGKRGVSPIWQLQR